MSTGRQILDAAYATSKLNQPGTTASETGELLPLLNRSLRGLFAEAARVNRKVFAKSSTQPVSGSGWARPREAEMILRIEAGSGMSLVGSGGGIAPGTLLTEVPFDQRNAEPGKPSLYSLGQVYQSVGRTGIDPATTGNLVFFYSSRPVTLDTLEQVLDALWPDQFDSLLVLEVAIYLARKDGGERRAQELAAFTAEFERERARFTSWLEHESIAEVKAYGHYNRINPPGVQVG
jgi:hypothetical protein